MSEPPARADAPRALRDPSSLPDPSPLRDPTAVVVTFLGALERLDADAAVHLLDDDVVYENVSLPTVRGRAAAARVLGLMCRRASGFEATCHRIAAEGPTVLTERTDAIVLGRVRIAFWVCGRFEVHDGRITHWRDYFDWANTTTAAVRGVVRGLASLLPTSAVRPA